MVLAWTDFCVILITFFREKFCFSIWVSEEEQAFPNALNTCLSRYLTSILWIHMRRVEAKVDEEGNRHSKLEPLHDIRGLLAIQGRGHVTPQDNALSSTRCHKPGLVSYSVGT